MENRLGNEYDVYRFNIDGYRIGTFVFNYREELNKEGEKVIEIDVYKLSSPVILYIKTFMAPYIENADPVEVCEALYEEFYEEEEE